MPSGDQAYQGERVNCALRSAPGRDRNLAGRVGHLFAVIRHPGTGNPYTNADVARISAGGVIQEEVKWMRTGKVLGPKVGQVAALAGVFGVARQLGEAR